MMRLNVIIKWIIWGILSGVVINSYATDSHNGDELISLNFHQAPTSIILQTLADSRQLNLILDCEVDTLQTVKLANINWYKALTIITRNAKLQYIIDNNILVITAIADPTLLLAQQRKEQIVPPLSLKLVL